jgi:isopenicillin N synthase-like dioxygenase
VLSAIAIGLGIAPRHFDQYCNKKDNNLRLLHYPAVPKSALDKADQARAGTHTGNFWRDRSLKLRLWHDDIALPG